MSWVGRSWSAGSDWILDTQLSQVVAGQPRRLALYAISGELTAVPEPSTIVLWGVFTGIAGLVFWRKRRQGN